MAAVGNGGRAIPISSGHLEGLIGLTGPVSELYGISVTSHTDAGTGLHPTLDSAIVTVTGTPGPGTSAGKGQTFFVSAVDDKAGTFTLLLLVNGSRVAQLTENVLGFGDAGVLYSIDPSTAITRLLDGNLSASDTLGLFSPSTALASGTSLSFSAAGSYAGAPAPTYAVAAGSAAKVEGNSGTTPFTFIVTRSGNPSDPATLSYAVTGSGTNPADASDFAGGVLPSGTVSFAAGATSAVIVTTVIGDTTVEPDETFTVTLSGSAGAVVTTPTAIGTIVNDDVAVVAPILLGYVNGTTGRSGTFTMDAPDPGAPSYLQAQYIYAFSDDFALSTSAPNVFIHTGSGNDAIQVSSGQNVLDGGLGSNFLTGGSGMDTFFTDARSPGAVWNTIRNFHTGDAATLWGFTTGVSSYRWEPDVAGAPGSEGATLRANIVGGAGRIGDGIDASITFTGLSVAQAQNLQIVTGSQPAGDYLFIYNAGL